MGTRSGGGSSACETVCLIRIEGLLRLAHRVALANWTGRASHRSLESARQRSARASSRPYRRAMRAKAGSRPNDRASDIVEPSRASTTATMELLQQGRDIMADFGQSVGF